LQLLKKRLNCFNSMPFSSLSLINPAKAFLISIFILIFSFTGCGPAREITRLSEEGESAYEAGNYQAALDHYRQLIELKEAREDEVSGKTLNRAGLSAYYLKKTSLSLQYLERARHTDAADERTYAALADGYREIDNLSREITNLEIYVNEYPDGERIEAMRGRYFETLVESMNWEQAYDLWPELDEETRRKESFLNGYFTVNKALGNDEQCTRLAKKLLQINENNTDALEWLGIKYFRRAESRYSREMEAYERNRTHRQYAILLEAFEVINEDFRTALNYLLKLYNIDPSPRIASYLANIYQRFENESKARYYRQKAQE